MKYQNVLVALDQSLMDEKLIRYTENLTKLIEMKKVVFIHIEKNLLKPSYVDLTHHDLFRANYPIDTLIKEMLCKEVKDNFIASGVDVEVELVEGKPLKSLLHWAKIKRADLVVFGKKDRSEGSGIIPKKMARHLSCDMLFVPEKFNREIKHIVVPVDFSEASRKALETAAFIQDSLDEEVRITAVHVLKELPSKSFFKHSVYQQYRSTIVKSAKEAFVDLINQMDYDSTLFQKYILSDGYGTIALELMDFIRKNPCDLVIMGGKEEGTLRTRWFGETAEGFVDRYDTSPVLIVR